MAMKNKNRVKTEVKVDGEILMQVTDLNKQTLDYALNIGIQEDEINDTIKLDLEKLQNKKREIINELLEVEATPKNIQVERHNGSMETISWFEYQYQHPKEAAQIIDNNKKHISSLKEHLFSVEIAINALLKTTKVAIDTLNQKAYAEKRNTITSVTSSAKNLAESYKAQADAQQIANIEIEKILKNVGSINPQIKQTIEKDIREKTSNTISDTIMNYGAEIYIDDNE